MPRGRAANGGRGVHVARHHLHVDRGVRRAPAGAMRAPVVPPGAAPPRSVRVPRRAGTRSAARGCRDRLGLRDGARTRRRLVAAPSRGGAHCLRRHRPNPRRAVRGRRPAAAEPGPSATHAGRAGRSTTTATARAAAAVRAALASPSPDGAAVRWKRGPGPRRTARARSRPRPRRCWTRPRRGTVDGAAGRAELYDATANITRLAPDAARPVRARAAASARRRG